MLYNSKIIAVDMALLAVTSTFTYIHKSLQITAVAIGMVRADAGVGNHGCARQWPVLYIYIDYVIVYLIFYIIVYGYI